MAASASCIHIGYKGCSTGNNCCGTPNSQCSDDICVDPTNENGDNSLINYDELHEDSIFSKINEIDSNGAVTLILIAIVICLVFMIVLCWVYMFCADKNKEEEEEEDDLSTMRHIVDWKTVVKEMRNKNDEQKMFHE